MTSLRQAAQAVVDHWDSPHWKNGTTAAVIADLRTALEKPPTEPFGYFRADAFCWTDCAETDEGAIALYEQPAQPLTDEMVHKAMIALNTESCGELQPTFEEMKAAIEAARNSRRTHED